MGIAMYIPGAGCRPNILLPQIFSFNILVSSKVHLHIHKQICPLKEIYTFELNTMTLKKRILNRDLKIRLI